MKLLANLFSYLFHPIFAPLISAYILFQLPTYLNFKLSQELINFVYGVVSLNLIVAPLLVSLYLKKKGFIQSLEMPTAKERMLPYLVSILFYTFTYFLFRSIPLPEFYLSVFLAALIVILTLLLFALVNKKVSAHLAALGGICGMLFMTSKSLNIDTSALLILFILTSGFVASSRIQLKAHTLMELILGFVAGFGIQIIVIS